MSSYIQSAQQNIRKIAEEIHASEAKDARYALVCYRDHPPQDNTYVTQVFNFTNSIQNLQQSINTMQAHGGGDYPESVCCALKAVLDLDYRKSAVKICVLIADAPPHGINEPTDSLPGGCPDGVDPLDVVEKMMIKEIIIYMIAVEPTLSNSVNGHSFYRCIVQKTGGRYFELGNANLLPQIIIGAAQEEITLNQVNNDFEEELKNVLNENKGKKMTEDEIITKVHTNLSTKGVSTVQLEVTHQSNLDSKKEVTDAFFSSKSLHEARSKPGIQQSISPNQQNINPFSMGSSVSAPPPVYSSLSPFSTAPTPSVSSNAFLSPNFSTHPPPTYSSMSPSYSPMSPSFSPSISPSPNYHAQSAQHQKQSINMEQVHRLYSKHNNKNSDL